MMPIILDFQNSKSLMAIFQNTQNCLTWILDVEIWFILTSNKKSWARNGQGTCDMLALTYDISYKIICNFEGQTAKLHTPPLWIPICMKTTIYRQFQNLQINYFILAVPLIHHFDFISHTLLRHVFSQNNFILLN